MKQSLILFGLLLIAGCMQPLYESDYPLYRQYKYWESADQDWQEVDHFQIQVYRTQSGSKTALRLVPQRSGMPSTADGYIQAAQKAAFNLMHAACSSGIPGIDAAVAPANGRTIDRFFYQYGDASVGVTFFCRSAPPRGMDLAAEQQKWSLAERRWDKIGNVKAFVDTLPAAADGRRQMRIRLFGGTLSDNRKLARRIVQNTCPNTNFRILSDAAGVDIVPTGRLPEVVSDENVRIYDFTCAP
ncbi:MAG: hypothetical protein IJ752_09190 [Alphaproteobacteria bacterium]|nr:hypothetical protein [Alphaproteobacteria bacterium]